MQNKPMLIIGGVLALGLIFYCGIKTLILVLILLGVGLYFYFDAKFSKLMTYDIKKGGTPGKYPEIDAKLNALTSQPLQSEHTCTLGVVPELAFDYIANFELIQDWMPMLTKTWTNNENAQVPGGAGSVRMIKAVGGKMTEEIVKLKEAPTLLVYSATDKSLGGMFYNHLGAQICLPEGNERTKLVWRSYAQSPNNALMRWLGQTVFKFVVSISVLNLCKRFPVK